MRPKRILALVCHRMRDLPGLVHLKVLLERKHGHEVRLAGLDTERQLVPTFRPHLIILPWIESRREVKQAHRYRAMGIKLVVIPTEGFSFWDVRRERIAGKYTDLTAVDLHFTWNEEVAELMRRHANLPAERILVGGVTRWDFYRPPLRWLLMSRERFCARYGLPADRQVVTFASNFILAQFRDRPQALESYRRRLQDSGVGQLPTLPFKSPEHGVEVDWTSRAMYTDAVAGLATTFPDVTFALKPHPGEDAEWYERWSARLSLANLVVVQDEFIWDVLNATDLQLHRASTTAIETWMLDKPTIDLQLNPHEAYFAEDLWDGEDVARDLDGLVDRVAYYLDGGAVPEYQLRARQRLIQRWFDRVDGRRTAWHARAISELLAQHADEPRIPLTREHAAERVKAQFRSLVGLEPHETLRNVLPGRRRNVWGDKGRYFTLREVREWEAKILQALPAIDGIDADEQEPALLAR